MAEPANANPSLKRAVGLPLLVMYGLGSMLGAGIYGLVGEAARLMGSAIWLAFLVSMVAALLTGLSYATIASRYPRAGGAAYVTQRAYRSPLLAYLVGLAVACSGLTSIATQANVVARNLQAAFAWEGAPVALLATGFLLVLSGILLRGIRESLWANAACTVVEALGLVLVIAVGIPYWGQASLFEWPDAPAEGMAAGGGMEAAGTALLVFQGAVLTFFSFIGFEDTLNLAEEVREPERTMPAGLILSMLAATVIYMAVCVTAVSVVPWRELAAAPAPLAEVVRRAAPWFPAIGFIAVTIFAVANTALVNYVMASRLLYGMARQGLLPAALGRVHPTRHTPHVAIGVLFVIVLALAMLGNIAALASATVLLLLFVFTVVNIALVILKRRPGEPRGRFEVPAAVPALGALVCAGLILVRVTTGNILAPLIAAGLLAAILLLYLATARSRGEALREFIGGDPPA
ncbi:amino acid transporter [Pseudoroseomonas rhizosphaerae]|uniref:Amino acid transporter n=1 Tax=Teichococcus rhizosphaerae TaxID=1335062 RepID=A0A2C7A8Z6_9PROT|nr:amino acid permease [Pseudoroseomonas rhizosphaerae]PHK94850.1 amino acid transporter [Pseudoroseomonas rhizosphaerae]